MREAELNLKISENEFIVLKFRQLLPLMISVLVSIGLLWLLLQKVVEFESLFLDVSWFYVGMAVISVFLVPMMTGLRLYGVLKSQKRFSISYFDCIRLTMVANVLNSFMPSKSGDFAKGALLGSNVSKSRRFAPVIIERLVDLFVIGIWAFVGAIIGEIDWIIWLGLCISLGVFVVFFLAVIYKKLERSIFLSKNNSRVVVAIGSFAEVVVVWLGEKKYVALTIFGSLLSWLINFFVFGFLILATGYGKALLVGMAVFPIAVIIGMIPIGINGLGTRDAALALLLKDVMDSRSILFAGVGYAIIAYWIQAIISVPFAYLKMKEFWILRSKLIK